MWVCQVLASVGVTCHAVVPCHVPLVLVPSEPQLDASQKNGSNVGVTGTRFCVPFGTGRHCA
jgi:hypothetical protein